MRTRSPGRDPGNSSGTVQRRELAPGKRSRTDGLVQRRPTADDVQGAAARGVASGGGELPYVDRIQASFGSHDVGDVRAHVGGAAAEASRAIGAEAYATGRDVAFAGAPDLHTAAHEAAHVVQQRAGVHLKGGVGEAGDPYEQHADAVADRVVRGESAQDLLDRFGGGGGGGGGAVQRKAVIGDDMHAPSASEANDQASQTLVADATPRRFKDAAEMKSFAAGTPIVGAGEMPDGTWVRVDPPMLVLGENHGDPIAPELIAATHVTNFRYEGYAHHSETRKGKSAAIDQTLEMLETERNARTGLQVGDDDPTHDAEHALPKYARTLADMIELVARQGRGGQQLGGKSTRAGDDLTAEYSTAKALIDGTLAALVYAQSYGKKFFKHAVKTAYNHHAAAIDAAIIALTAHKAGADTHRVPNFTTMGITVQLLTELHAAYRTAAQEKVGLDTSDKRDAWKAKLNTTNEPNVAETGEAKEDDYLRDKSMFDTIKKALAGGDRLFVIGGAHQQKLAPLIRGTGARTMTDKAYLDEQKQLNLRAAAGQAAYDKLGAAKRTVESSRFKSSIPRPTVGVAFTMPAVDGCTWEVGAGVHAGVGPREFIADATMFQMTLVWLAGGQRVEVKSYSTLSAIQPKPAVVADAHDQPAAPPDQTIV